MTFPSDNESWIRKVFRVYTLSFAFLLLSWGMLLFLNFLYPHFAAPDISNDGLAASVVHITK